MANLILSILLIGFLPAVWCGEKCGYFPSGNAIGTLNHDLDTGGYTVVMKKTCPINKTMIIESVKFWVYREETGLDLELGIFEEINGFSCYMLLKKVLPLKYSRKGENLFVPKRTITLGVDEHIGIMWTRPVISYDGFSTRAGWSQPSDPKDKIIVCWQDIKMAWDQTKQLSNDEDGEKKYAFEVNFAPAIPCNQKGFNSIAGLSSQFQYATPYRTDMDITLEMLHNFECPIDEISYTWTIISMSPKNTVNLPSKVFTRGKSITIPRFTLELGGVSSKTYKVKGTVHVVPKNRDDKKFEAGQEMYFKLDRPSLYATIYGGSQRSIASAADYVIADASGSYDPEYHSENGPDNSLIFKWFCVKEAAYDKLPTGIEEVLDEADSCLITGKKLRDDSKKKISIKIQDLDRESSTGKTTYVLRVLASKPDRTTVHADQTIVIGDNQLSISIKCVINCEGSVNPSDRITLMSVCNHCIPGQYIYRWSLLKDDKSMEEFDFDKETFSGDEGSNLVVKPGFFSKPEYAGKKFSFKLTLLVGFDIGNALLDFTVNAPPKKGSCTVKPGDGVELQTLFDISCTEFDDPDKPLKYEYSAIIKDERVVLMHGPMSSTSGIFLPHGDPDNDYILELEIVVSDAYGASVTVLGLRALVVSAVQDTDALVEKTTGNNSILQKALKIEDTQEAMRIITGVSSMLNTLDVKTHTSDTKKTITEVRDQVMDSLVKIQVKSNIMDLQQSANAVTQVTQAKEDLSDNVQKKAADYLLTLAECLENVNPKEATQKQMYDTGKHLAQSVTNVIGSLLVQEKGNIKSVDKRNAKIITQTSLSSLGKLKKMMQKSIVEGEGVVSMTTDTLTLSVQKKRANSIQGSVLGDSNGDGVVLPKSMSLTTEGVVTMQQSSYEDNPYFWADGGGDVNNAVLQYEFVDEKEEPLKVELNEPAVLTFKLKNITYQNMNLTSNDPSNDTLGFIRLDADSESYPYLVIRIDDKSLIDNVEVYLVRDDDIDQVLLYDEIQIARLDKPISFDKTETPGTFEAMLPKGSTKYLIIVMLRNDNDIGAYEMQIELMTTKLKCVYWKELSEAWATDGCTPHHVSLIDSKLTCHCTHMSTFASNFFISPNPIDFSKVVLFLEFWTNPFGVIACAVLVVLYIPAAIWAIRKDNQRAWLKSLVELPDTDSDHQFKYIITLETGDRKNAGTTATVYMQLIGELGKSDPVRLICATHDMCQRAMLDFFSIKTEDSLGDIEAIYFQHDNEGDSPDWFVNQCVVYDTQAENKYTFFCNSWMSKSTGRGVQQAFLPVDDDVKKEKIGYILMTNITHNMKEKHLLLSVAKVPPESTFTLLQRVTCLLCLFFSVMLTNIMFYGIPYKPEEISVGWGYFTWRRTDVIIMIQTSVLMVPLTGIVTHFFTLIKPRTGFGVITADGMKIDAARRDSLIRTLGGNNNRNNRSQNNRHLTTWNNNSSSNRNSNKPANMNQNADSVDLEDDTSIFLEDDTSIEKTSKRSKGPPLPWWCIYFAYILVFTLCGGQAFFIILYTFNFGKEKSLKWLVSLFTTEALNMFVFDPLQILTFAAMIVFIYRKSYIENINVEDESVGNDYEGPDEETDND